MTIYQVDSFTKVPFSGNPAGVCIVEKTVSEEWMQKIAAEMNLSETAFIQPVTDEERYSLRWFTPLTEVGLCGHATVASAHILYTEGIHDFQKAIRFSTKSGELTVTLKGDLIEMVFPRRDVEKVAEYQTLSATNAEAVIVTSKGDGTEYDFVSRFFAPAVGINEDPVTGSAHCYLAPFWAARFSARRKPAR